MTRHALFLAIRHLRASPLQGLVMALGIAVALFLPLITWAVGARAEDRLLARARATPIVLGRPGDEFDLVMASLYFRGQVRDPLSWEAAQAVSARDYGAAVPLYLAHSAGGVPVVGTSLGYLEARGLRIAEGRTPAVLGEVIAGAQVAEDFGVHPGDTVRSDLSNLYMLAGSTSLLLKVVGVLAPTGGPDDGAWFADVKTLWALDGLIHGHKATAQAEVNPGIFTFDSIDRDTLASFHAHGDAGDWPVSAILVFPRDQRAHDELLGDLALDPELQATRPVEVVRAVLDIVLRLQTLLGSWMLLVALSTAGFVGLVVSLSLRLRRAEIALMRRLGASRSTLAAVLGAELALLGLGGLLAATGLSALGLWGLERLFG